jgi:hypothetical protein
MSEIAGAHSSDSSVDIRLKIARLYDSMVSGRVEVNAVLNALAALAGPEAMESETLMTFKDGAWVYDLSEGRLVRSRRGSLPTQP